MCFNKQVYTLRKSVYKAQFRNICYWTNFEVKLLTSRWRVKWFRSQHESMSRTNTFEKGNFHSYFLGSFFCTHFACAREKDRGEKPDIEEIQNTMKRKE